MNLYTGWIVKDYVREHHRRRREMFVPLIHPPGHAQADFGEARAVIGGVARKTHFFVFDLPHSDACYVRAYGGHHGAHSRSRTLADFQVSAQAVPAGGLPR